MVRLTYLFSLFFQLLLFLIAKVIFIEDIICYSLIPRKMITII